MINTERHAPRERSAPDSVTNLPRTLDQDSFQALLFNAYLNQQSRARSRMDDALRLATIVATQQEITAREPGLNELVNLVASRVLTITGAAGAAIALITSGEMICRASCGAIAPALGAKLSANSGLSGECVRTGQTLRCVDSESDPRVNREAARLLGIRSMALVPLVLHGDVVGVFELFSPRAAAFDDQDVRILELMSGLIGTARSFAAELGTSKTDAGTDGGVSEQKQATPPAAPEVGKGPQTAEGAPAHPLKDDPELQMLSELLGINVADPITEELTSQSGPSNGDVPTASAEDFKEKFAPMAERSSDTEVFAPSQQEVVGSQQEGEDELFHFVGLSEEEQQKLLSLFSEKERREILGDKKPATPITPPTPQETAPVSSQPAAPVASPPPAPVTPETAAPVSSQPAAPVSQPPARVAAQPVASSVAPAVATPAAKIRPAAPPAVSAKQPPVFTPAARPLATPAWSGTAAAAAKPAKSHTVEEPTPIRVPSLLKLTEAAARPPIYEPTTLDRIRERVEALRFRWDLIAEDRRKRVLLVTGAIALAIAVVALLWLASPPSAPSPATTEPQANAAQPAEAPALENAPASGLVSGLEASAGTSNALAPDATSKQREKSSSESRSQSAKRRELIVVPGGEPNEPQVTPPPAPLGLTADVGTQAAPLSDVLARPATVPELSGAKPVRISQGVIQGNLVHKVPPAYPTIAKITGTSGTVVLSARIAADGSVKDIRVISGHKYLNDAAVQAVSQWRYRPYMLGGQPVEVDTQIRVNFTR